jgi:hypothetical protein
MKLLKEILVVLAMLVAMTAAGCGALTPNTASLATSKAILAASEQLDSLNRLGELSDARELEYQKTLLEAHDVLSGTRAVSGVSLCNARMNKYECADEVLIYIERILRGLE